MRLGKLFVWFLALLSLIGVFAGCSYVPYSPPPVAFSGDSSAAQETLVVPTLDTPAPKGKNVIWCATFQLCWDQLKPLTGQINVPGAQDTVRRLDNSHDNTADLPAGAYYLAAGFAKDDIVQKILTDMAAKFPTVKPNLPPMKKGDDAALAYAYLREAIKFRTAYFDHQRGDDFIDSAGKRTHVSSFGLYEKNREADINDTLARQIDVLYCGKEPYPQQEFVLDLDNKSQPSQIILACVRPKESLAATWQDVKQKIDGWQPDKEERKFGDHDHLAVPNVNYKIQHSFKELQASGMLITFQSIEFLLDRSGAGLASQAYFGYLWGGGRSFNFTKPFLIVMRKRGSTEPYFVMWVDNAELLCKQNDVKR